MRRGAARVRRGYAGARALGRSRGEGSPGRSGAGAPGSSRRVRVSRSALLVHWGVTTIFRYDPLGRLIRTDLPNGTFSRIEFTPWQETSWDENDRDHGLSRRSLQR
jgi:hypothetical protein